MSDNTNTVTDEKFIKISKNWLQGNDNLISNYGELGFGFCVYCKVSEQAYDKSSKVSIGEFLDLYGFTHRATRKKKRDELLVSIGCMERDGFLDFYKDISLVEVGLFSADVKNSDTLYCSINDTSNENNKNKFVKISKLEFVKILSASGNRLRLLIHFIALMFFEDNENKISYPSIESIIKITNYSKDTAMRYNATLQELEVVYYANAGMKYMEKFNHFQSFSNTYSRYNNKDKVDDYINKLISNEKSKIVNTNKTRQANTNKSRSLSLIIKNLEKVNNKNKNQLQRLEMLRKEYEDLRALIKENEGKGYEWAVPKK